MSATRVVAKVKSGEVFVKNIGFLNCYVLSRPLSTIVYLLDSLITNALPRYVQGIAVVLLLQTATSMIGNWFSGSVCFDDSASYVALLSTN